MPRAIVDPEELRRFASDLKRFSADCQTSLNGIHRRFVRLGESWRDQEHAKFAEDFERMLLAVAKFVEASDRQVPLLLRKAESIQEYLDRR